MAKPYTNPWSARWQRINGHSDDPLEDQAIEFEAVQAENEPTYPCQIPGCTGTAYYRPGVGGWWCDTCREYQRPEVSDAQRQAQQTGYSAAEIDPASQ